MPKFRSPLVPIHAYFTLDMKYNKRQSSPPRLLFSSTPPTNRNRIRRPRGGNFFPPLKSIRIRDSFLSSTIRREIRRKVVRRNVSILQLLSLPISAPTATSEIKSIFDFWLTPRNRSRAVSIHEFVSLVLEPISSCNLDEQFPGRSGAGIRKPPTYVSRSKFRTVAGHLG